MWVLDPCNPIFHIDLDVTAQVVFKVFFNLKTKNMSIKIFNDFLDVLIRSNSLAVIHVDCHHNYS
jgi:hypothetical protein